MNSGLSTSSACYDNLTQTEKYSPCFFHDISCLSFFVIFYGFSDPNNLEGCTIVKSSKNSALDAPYFSFSSQLVIVGFLLILALAQHHDKTS